MNDETTGGATGALLESDIPVAHVRTSQGPRSPSRRSSRFWFVTAACLFIAAGLVIYSLITTGLNITIRFDNGHGIQPGDAVRFRGIDIGKVLTVELNEQLDVVTVRAVLNPASAGLARQSSQFWIERPLLSATEVRGLDTLVGGRFMGIAPGPLDGPRQVDFDGLDSAPSGEVPEGSLEIVLEANERGGLQRGAPVLYRGLKIGHIVSVALSVDAATVEARTLILPAFKQLVRGNTVFWETSGIDLSVGLSGLRLSVDTLSTIVLGGVSMATPDTPGQLVTTGHRFSVQENVDDEKMLRWKPLIQIGELAELPHGAPPTLARAALRWKESVLGIRHTRRRQGWLVLLDQSGILGPIDMFLFDPADPSREGVLEVEGRQITIRADQLQISGTLARYRLSESENEWAAAFPVDRLRFPSGPEDCLIVTSSHAPPIPLATNRAVASGDVWRIDPSLALGPDWHGAAVVATADGCLIGIVVEQQGEFHVGPLRGSD